MFIIISVINLFVSIYIYTKVPEFFLRFCVYVVSIILYRVKVKGGDNIPEEGPAVIVSNHISFVDWMFLLSASTRPIRFVIYAPIYHHPLLNWLFKMANAIPINSLKADPDTYHQAFKDIKIALGNGELIGLFPEGKISNNGKVDTFRKGIEIILKQTPCDVIPVHIDGLWGSLFSRKNKVKRPRFAWSLVKINIGEKVTSELASAEYLQMQVIKLSNSEL